MCCSFLWFLVGCVWNLESDCSTTYYEPMNDYGNMLDMGHVIIAFGPYRYIYIYIVCLAIWKW
jgi:hypothetical protein